MGDHPRFDEFLNRTTNRDALCCFIGSLFFEPSNRQQYVWLYGEGLNGKGSFLKLLQRVFGPAYVAKEPPRAGGDSSRFWSFGLLGKRLCGLSDCSDYTFPASSYFKMLTGDDVIPMEEKGKNAFTAPINCKFIFASNEKPEITSQKSDMRRAIFCEIEQIKDDVDPNYDKKLWIEAPAIIGNCMALYELLCKDHGPIKSENVGLEKIIDESNYKNQYIFDSFFNLDNERLNPKKNDRDILKFSPQELARVVDIEGLKRKDKNNFIKFLKAKYGIEYKQFKNETGQVDRAYIGASIKSVRKHV